VLANLTVSTPKTVHIDFDPDERFAAAAGGVARYLADEAGLNAAAVSELHAAVVEACRELFDSNRGLARLRASFCRFGDRIEISVLQPGRSWLSSEPPSSEPQSSEPLGRLFPGVERVEYNNDSGESVILLTRHLSS
jgi:hypothetical protein